MPDPSHPPSILTFAKSLHGGGVERAMLRLVAGWVAAGRQVTLVLGVDGGPHAGEVPEGVALIVLDRDDRGLAAALPAIVRRAAPDIIFCPGNHYTGAAAWLRLRLGRDCPPIVAKVSNRLDRSDQRFPVRQGYRAWLRLHPRFLDRMVAMSPAMAAETVRMTGIAADRVGVIANPPTLPGSGAPAEPLAGDYLIGIGRLSRQKRWDRAIAALAKIARRDVQLLILGEGEERAALEAQVAALGLADRVHLPGYVTDPRPALAGARALVLTSDFEGVPGVLQEALAVGTPVVATESSVAIRELVADPCHGIVVPPDDARALVAALDYWLAPDRERPDPVPERGHDAIECYLRLFDDVVREHRLTRAG